MKNLYRCAALATAVWLSACSVTLVPPATTETPRNPLAEQALYKGTLPCADCDGIEVSLVLYRDGQQQPSRYQLTERYLGNHTNLTVINRGDWEKIANGFRSDGRTQEVYSLSPDDPNSHRLFLPVSDTQLELLGEDGSRHDNSQPYTLNEVKN